MKPTFQELLFPVLPKDWQSKRPFDSVSISLVTLNSTIAPCQTSINTEPNIFCCIMMVGLLDILSFAIWHSTLRWTALLAGWIYIHQHPHDAWLPVEELCDMVGCEGEANRVLHYAAGLRETQQYTILPVDSFITCHILWALQEKAISFLSC